VTATSRAGARGVEASAFTEAGPWELEVERLPWRMGIDALRERTRAEVPRLLRRRRLPPAGRLLKVVANLGGAVAGWYLFDRRSTRARSRAGLSRRLRRAFERLGPTYIKLGQILSAGEGIFPEELVLEFRLLRDRVPPEELADVHRTVEEDLGQPVEAIFSRFEAEPVAAASVAQVHGATLRSGEEVVVKVQRPEVARLVKRDLAVMSWLAPALVGRIPVSALANPPALVELFAETIAEELDFRLEAQNMLDIAHVLADTGQTALVVPRPHPRLVTRRVLVMERLEGFAWDDIAGMKEAGIDTSAVIHAGMVAFLEGAMLYGVFHGDLHGGNLLVREDGRVAVLDFGITGRFSEPQRLAFLRLVMGATVNDVRMQISALCDLGALPLGSDVEAVVADLGLDRPPLDPTKMSPDELLAEVRELTKALLSYGARLPKELMLYVKNLLFLDGALATLAPDVDLIAEVGEIASYFAQRYGDRIAQDVGLDPREMQVDLDGLRASVGLTPDVEGITHRELQQRRDLIRKRMEEHRERNRRPLRRRLLAR
jgi:ubiquinone biosynthesis protein